MSWQILKLETGKIPARPDGLWTMVYEYLEGPVTLKFAASGVWRCAPDHDCGPDGLRGVGFVEGLIVPSAPLGALVGKIGGSTADKPDAAKQTVFTVGGFCIFSVDEKVKGPLLLTMNDFPLRFTAHDKALGVQIWRAK